MKNLVRVSLAILLLSVTSASADTFVNSETAETYHGYATGKENAGLSEVFTTEKGVINVNLNQFKVTPDRTGRNNAVALLEIPAQIALGMETTAFEDAIKDAVSKGPLFILIEIDSPGGRVDFAIRMCTAIADVKNCDVYAYINGGSNGGAYSAGAAIAMACDKIYMAPGTALGAATLISMNEEGKPVDIKEVLGEKVGEKMSSGWRNYLASLAENNNRPTVLARAMEDKDIEALEITRDGKKVFVDSVNKKPTDTVVKTWSKKGSLLTLPAKEAVECGMADKIYGNRQDLLQAYDATTAEILPDKSMEKARKLREKIERSIKKINASVDLGVKQLQATQSRAQALKAMRSLINDAKFVIGLKKKFGDDVPIDEEIVQSFLNSVQAEYDSLAARR